MTLCELEKYLNEFLKIKDYENDIALNGVQIQNSDKNKVIKKIAFAVDACLESVEKAIEINADILIVHHGIFWGDVQAIVGNHYNLVKKMIENDIALYACHIPLDANEQVGNNFGLANFLKLKNLERFGSWRGMNIGVKGEFEKSLSLKQIENQIFDFLSCSKKDEKLSDECENKSESEKMQKAFPLGILPFGKEEICSVGIISGGACEDVSEAIDENLDLYITGEINHQIYHLCKESKINFIACGHYNSETVGVRLLAEKLNKEFGLETEFLHIPTGL